MSAAATRRARAFCGVPPAARATSTGAVDLAAPPLLGILQVGWPVRPTLLLKTSVEVGCSELSRVLCQLQLVNGNPLPPAKLCPGAYDPNHLVYNTRFLSWRGEGGMKMK